MKAYDRFSSILFLILAFIVIWQSAIIPMGRISKPGPGFLPFWVGIILALLSAVLWVESGSNKSPSGKIQFLSGEGRWQDVLWTAGFLLGFTFLVDILGFVITTLLFLFFIFRFVGKQKWWIVFTGTILVTLSIYVIFKVCLQVQLPAGLLAI